MLGHIKATVDLGVSVTLRLLRASGWHKATGNEVCTTGIFLDVIYGRTLKRNNKNKKQQETQLSLTNDMMHLCKRNGMADLKHIPPHMCYHAQLGSSALKGVGQ